MIRTLPGRREIHCWTVGLDAAWPQPLQASLSPGERERSERLRYARDCGRFVVAHAALRDILAGYLRTRPERLRFTHNAQGKPALAAEFDGKLRFNLAHASDLALVAVAGDSELGVDLERAPAPPGHADIARQLFSQAEADLLASVPEHEAGEAFLRCWTRKEAYVKARGNGLSMPLDGFSVPLSGDAADGWSYFSLSPAPGFIGAIAVEGTGWRLVERRWN